MLSHAITVPIAFREGEFSDEKRIEEIMLKKLQDALIPLFEISPPCLYKSSYPTTADFLSELITEVGPVFVSLDEIGFAFHIQDRNDIQRRDLFLRFCGGVLRNWLVVPKLFFLVLGRGSFLNYVSCRPGSLPMLTVSRFAFKRLSLKFLRPASIKQILHQTYIGEETLFDYYNLNDAQADIFAERLFWQTTGNPRSLLKTFKECSSKEELWKAESSQITNYHEFYNYILLYKKQVEDLMNKAQAGEPVDLTKVVISQERSVPLEIIANHAYIAWDGELEAAQLTASPATTRFFATYFLPLDEFLQSMMKYLRAPLDFPEVFEIMLVKRFQQIFASPQCPRNVMPSFFDSPRFGMCEDLKLCDEIRSMPQILPGGNGVRLQDKTADQTAWPFLVEQMDKFPSLCLKPPPRSA